MVAGCLSNSGYFMGEQLHAANDANPKGFFEDVEINRINEDLLAQVVAPPPPIIGKWLFNDRPTLWQRWLARVPVGTPIPSPEPITKRMRAQVAHQPYCFKDPRFSYTLPVWRPYLRDTVFICVFREPGRTARSIVKECNDAPYLQSLRMTVSLAIDAWTLMYRSILELHSQDGEWLFIHYDQVMEQEGLDRLERFTGATIDRSFPEQTLRRSPAASTVPTEAQRVYETLCTRAKYHVEALNVA
jgi:hypothetical protein